MKKSQLKNLIRESIKELSEQTTQPPSNSTANPGFMEVRLRTCNGTMQTPICLNSQAGYEIGHQFKHYDVMNNVRTSFIEDILGIGWCFNSTIGNPGEPSLQSDILEDPYVGACEANPNSTFVADPEQPSDDSVVSPTDPNPDYITSDPSTLDFPQGFEPNEWAQGWATNLSQYMEEDMSGVCNFITERIELWTSQYQTAGPLYQNQLVYKIQLGYFILQYLPCDGSAGLPGAMLSEQKAMKALPSKLTSFLKNLAKKTASNLMKSLEQKSRMKKLANIKPPRKR